MRYSIYIQNTVSFLSSLFKKISCYLLSYFNSPSLAITESLYEALLWVARLLISSMRLYLDIDDRGASIKSLIVVCLAFIILN